MNHKNLPNDASEIIERIATRLGQKFRFGYHTLDDMKQQAALLILGIQKGPLKIFFGYMLEIAFTILNATTMVDQKSHVTHVPYMLTKNALSLMIS